MTTSGRGGAGGSSAGDVNDTVNGGNRPPPYAPYTLGKP